MPLPKYEDMYGSDYVAPEDLPRTGVRVKFVKAEPRQLNCTGAKTAWKLVMWAQTADGKPMKKLIALNKTSAKQLCKAWGKPVDDYHIWLGKLADLSHVKIKAFGSLKDAVLITPVMAATEANRETFDGASEEMGEGIPVIHAQPEKEQPKAAPIKPPQEKAKPAPAKEPEAPSEVVQNTDPNTGEVFSGEEAQEEPLDELMITNVTSSEKKRPDGSPYTIWFVTASDGKVYFTTEEEKGNMAGLRWQDKRGALIQTGEPTINKGKSYFPIVSIQ